MKADDHLWYSGGKAEAVRPKPKYRLASLNRRIAAKAIDVAFTMGIMATGGPFLMLFRLPQVLSPLTFLAAIAYWFFADGFAGRSLGKRVLGLKVVDYKHGYPCRFGQSFLRNFAFGWLRVFQMAEEFDAIEAGTFNGQVVIDLRPSKEQLTPPPLPGTAPPPAAPDRKGMDLEGIASFLKNRRSPEEEENPSGQVNRGASNKGSP